MYRINDNKRVQRSAALITDAMLNCLNEKPFEEITVSDIQRLSGVSRATFYRLFDNTNDVLTYYSQFLVEDIMNQSTAQSIHNYKDFLLFLFEALLDNHTFLEAVFKSGSEEIIMNSLLSNSMQKHNTQSQLYADEKEMDYLISGTCGFLVGILRVWIKHGKQETPEELFDIMMRMAGVVSTSLFQK